MCIKSWWVSRHPNRLWVASFLLLRLLYPLAYLYAEFGACSSARASYASRLRARKITTTWIFFPSDSVCPHLYMSVGQGQDIKTSPSDSVCPRLYMSGAKTSSWYVTDSSHSWSVDLDRSPPSRLSHLDTVTYHAPLSWVGSSVGFILWMELKPTACPSCLR